jgi:peptide/nickel transport system permease protein
MTGIAQTAAAPLAPTSTQEVVEAIAKPPQSQWHLMWLAFRDHRAAYLSLWVLLGIAVGCIVLPFLLPWSPTQIDYSLVSASAPSARHPLGTDMIGRDVLARLLSAGRISLLIGFMVAIFSGTVGATVGITAGFIGGKTDERIMWFVSILMTIPSLPILIAMSSVVSSSNSAAGKLLATIPPEWRIILVMSLLGWMAISRVVRSKVIALRGQEFVEASIALGASPLRLMLVHILPNTVSVLTVFVTFAVSTAILWESALSFLGVGVMPPTATWGNMLLDARDIFTAVHYWWLAWFPALMILVTVLTVNFVGDGLRDAFDPKSAGK